MAGNADDKLYEGCTKEAHPELFDLRAMLPQPKELKPGQLPEVKIRQYFEDVSLNFILPYMYMQLFKFTMLYKVELCLR